MGQKPYSVKLRSDRISQSPKRRSLLHHLDLELTERCNFNCIHCCINLPAGDTKARKRELTTSEIKNILNQAASLGCLTVKFSGGEPLLREDFDELYIDARKLGLKIIIFTNAALITPKRAALFSRIPPLEPIEVSLYGMKEKSYQGITRRRGSFDAVFGGINQLIENRIPFVVKSAIVPSNREEIDEIETWAATTARIKKRPSFAMFFDLRCRRDDDGKNRRIKKLRPSPEEAVKMLEHRKDEQLQEYKRFGAKFMSPQGDRLFSCGAGKGSGCVDAYGFFQLCTLLRHPATVYDLKQGSLKEALLDFFPRVRQTRATNREYLGRCAVCFLKGLCEQCPARSWIEHGTLDTPVEYRCEIAHAQARSFGLIAEGEFAWEVRNWQERRDRFVTK